MVSGWLGYVHHNGQKPTCRQCSQTGHVFANCPQREKNEARSEETPKHRRDEHNTEPEDMDTHEPSLPNEPHLTEEERRSTPSVQEENPELYKPGPDHPAHRDAYVEILENLESAAKDDLSHLTVEDCQVPTSEELEEQHSEESSKQSQAWADSCDNSCEAGSEKPQETSKKAELRTKIKIKVGPTVYCPYCQVDSHTEEQCDKVSFARQTAKTEHGGKDSKPSRSESLEKRRKNIQGFKADLESIVSRGNRGSDVQYILESDDPENLYALYLLSRFGHRLTALSARKLFITRNTRVMDLWSKYSGENLSRCDTEELLMKAYERF